ncbi:MAG: PTS sugar transporter subunit IIC [Candidatus Asgardarchaeia archaeon]
MTPIEYLMILFVIILSTIDMWSGAPFCFQQTLLPCFLVSLALGDLKDGIIVAGYLTVAFMGIMQIGAAVPPDMISGSILASALAIEFNLPPEIAVAIGIPCSIVASYPVMAAQSFDTRIVRIVERRIKNRDLKALPLLNAIGLLPWAFARIFIFTILYTTLSLVFSQGLSEIFPYSFVYLSTAGKVLITLSIAILMNILWDERGMVFYLMGFLIAISGIFNYLQICIFAILIITAIHMVCKGGR